MSLKKITHYPGLTSPVDGHLDADRAGEKRVTNGMAAKVVALFLMAAVVVDAKALDGAKTHASKPKKDKAAAAPSAIPSADGGSPPTTAAKCARNRVASLWVVSRRSPCLRRAGPQKSRHPLLSRPQWPMTRRRSSKRCASRLSLAALVSPACTPVRLVSTADA